MAVSERIRAHCLLRSAALVTALLLVALMSDAAAAAEADGSDRARELIRDMERLYRADSSEARVTMRVETPHYERTMTMESVSLGADRALIRILSPRKDAGISTLKIDQEMWNYFPKINKVIKVPPSMMMGSWMGSDFTNDDLVKETTLIDEYYLELTESDELYTIVLRPKEDAVSLWARIDYSIDKERMVPTEQVFYDDDGARVRVLTYSDPKQFSGVMLPSVLEMVPLNKEGHRTVVVYDTLELNLPDIGDDIFTLRNLKRRVMIP